MANENIKKWVIELRNKRLLLLLISLGACYVITSSFKYSNAVTTMLNELALAVGSAFLLYYLVTWIPHQRKKAMVKTHLNKSYQKMKREILQEILTIANMQEHNMRIEELTNNPEEFRKVFEGKESNEGWYRFTNGLTCDINASASILCELKFFRKELDFVMLLYPVKGDSYKFIRDFQNATLVTLENYYELKGGRKEYKEAFYKSLSRNLWSLFTHWSFLDGQLDFDPYQKFIDNL
jgi:hypothetical protein